MALVKLSDSNKEKCDALESIGITVSNHKIKKDDKTFIKYVISIKDEPRADDYMETTFNSINEIIMAFCDRLQKSRMIAA